MSRSEAVQLVLGSKNLFLKLLVVYMFAECRNTCCQHTQNEEPPCEPVSCLILFPLAPQTIKDRGPVPPSGTRHFCPTSMSKVKRSARSWKWEFLMMADQMRGFLEMYLLVCILRIVHASFLFIYLLIYFWKLLATKWSGARGPCCTNSSYTHSSLIQQLHTL